MATDMTVGFITILLHFVGLSGSFVVKNPIHWNFYLLSRVRLSKRRQKHTDQRNKSRLVVTHRPLTGAEDRTHRHRDSMLQAPGEEDEEEYEDYEEEEEQQEGEEGDLMDLQNGMLGGYGSWFLVFKGFWNSIKVLINFYKANIWSLLGTRFENMSSITNMLALNWNFKELKDRLNFFFCEMLVSIRCSALSLWILK